MRVGQSGSCSRAASNSSPKPMRLATVGELLVGPHVVVVEQELELDHADAEVVDDLEVAGRLRVLGLVVLGRRDAEALEGVETERPLLGGVDVGDEEPDLLAEDAHEQEELLGDRHEAEHAALARLGAQRVHEALEGLTGARREQHDLPQPVLAPGGDCEVDGRVVHGDLLAHVPHHRTAEPVQTVRPGHGRRRVWAGPGRVTGDLRHSATRPGPSAYPSGHVRQPAHPRRRPPAGRAQAHHPARRAHRLPDLPPPRRRARHPARLRGHPRRSGSSASPSTTPVSPTMGVKLADPRPLVVPILRAGLGMLDGMQRLLPTAEVGFLGMVRNEETLEVSTYADRMPQDISGRQVFALDPMLATGGTLVDAINLAARPRRHRRHRDLPARRARGHRAAARGVRRPRRARHRRDRRPRRAAQREGLHRARPRRRGRPALRRRLTAPQTCERPTK